MSSEIFNKVKEIKWFNFLALVITVIIFLFEVHFFRDTEVMSGVYTAPYFSGAANNGFFDKDWQFNPYYGDAIKEMNYYELMAYDFPRESDNILMLDNTGFNNKGLLYIIKASYFLFPFLGQAGSLVLLQMIFQLLISYLIICQFKRPWLKILFLMLYTLNPLIVTIVMTPYYYFWQVIPSIICIYLLLIRKISFNVKVLVCLTSLFMFFVRPTTIFINLFNVFLIQRFSKPVVRFVSPLLFLISVITFGQFNKGKLNSSPWHTATAGLNAYPSKCITGFLGDDYVYSVFAQISGDSVTGALMDPHMYDPEYRDYYYGVLKENYLNELRKCPGTIVRNGALNTASSFSWGYIAGYTVLNILSSIIGLCIVVILLWNKFYFQFLAILLTSASYTLLYPPVHSYMFGGYLLIIFFILRVGNKFLERRDTLHFF